MLTHDSISKIISFSIEASIEFESVDLLFKMLGSFFYIWASDEFEELFGFKDLCFYLSTDLTEILSFHSIIVSPAYGCLASLDWFNSMQHMAQKLRVNTFLF